MHVRPVFFASLLAVSIACWFAVPSQQQGPPAVAIPAVIDPIVLDPAQVTAIASEISQRSEQLKPMLDQVHTADWVARDAPEAYVAQWRSLKEQNQAIEDDMTTIEQHPEAMSDIMKALFRVHRFDSDLEGLLKAVRRYQNPALADLIESVAAGDQSGLGKLQQYVLDLASEKERLLDVEDKEAQRCRSELANQPPARPAARKTTGTPK
jgi:hypothetical protein